MSTSSAKRPVIQELKCPNCGAPVQQFSPDAQTIICQKCGSYVALDMEGPTVSGRGRRIGPSKFPIKIGDTATLDGTEFFVMGRVSYTGWDDEDRWYWDEWLMGGADGRLLWLSYASDEGFVLFRKLRVREAFDAHSAPYLPTGDGKKVRVHERYPAQIVAAEGELTWRAKPGENLYMAEAFGNGKRYSVQQTPDELEIHEGLPMTQEQVAAGFKNTAWMDSVKRAGGMKQTAQWVALLFIIFAIWGGIGTIWSTTTGEHTLTQTVSLSRANPTMSIPVEFDRIGRAAIVAVHATGAIPMNSSIDIDVGIDSPDGMENELFTLELWRESGSDDEGYWEETQADASDMFVPFQTGTHNLEIALGEGNIDTISVNVDIRRNHIMPLWFAIYTVVVAVIGGLIFYASVKLVSK